MRIVSTVLSIIFKMLKFNVKILIENTGVLWVWFDWVLFGRSYVAEVTPLMLHAEKEPARQQVTEFLIVTK